MLKFVRNVVFGLLFCVAPAAQMFAQLHPLPGSKSQAAVNCTGCPGNNAQGQANDGLPTYPYGSPIVDHTGRYVDSVNTASFQNLGMRTARAQLIRVAPDRRGNVPPRIYIQMGSAIGAYSLDTFFSTKLPGGMVGIETIIRGIMGFGRTPPEKILKWDQFLYPEGPDTGWRVPFQDGQDRLSDFDFDDRGNVYAACFAVFGWGIVKDDGKTDGSHLAKVAQMIPGGNDGEPARYPKTLDDRSGVTPKSIVTFKSGSKYYAIVTDKFSSAALWDVTDPANPRLSTTKPGAQWAMKKWDRDDATGRLAYVGADSRLYIFDYADYVTGGPALVEQTSTTGAFVDLAFDESSNLWAAEGTNNIWKYAPAGNDFTATKYSPYGGRTFNPAVMHAHNGFLLVAGIDRSAGAVYDLQLLKLESTGPRLVDVDGFFRKYYHSAPTGYAEPGSYRGIQADVQVVKSNSKTYVMYSLFGLGDVYEIEGSDSISIKMKNNTFGTPNPNAKSTAEGPYAGDTVTFHAPSSNAQVTYDVTWDFGNPEVGTSQNQGINKSTQDISHQYSALATAAAITPPKTIRAVTVQDSSIGSQYILNLKVPTPRIGISGITAPITIAPTNLEVVAGQTFNDASDGSIEGHYGTWTIDAVPTKLPPNGTISVGGVGPHTLSFQAAYGKYDGTFNGTSPYLPSPISFSYTVRPFKATLKPPTADATNVTFSATPNVTSDVTVLTATTWTITWTFTPGGTATAAPTTQTQTVAIGTVPNFVIPKSQVTAGSTVSVQAAVDLLGLAPIAQQYASVTDTMTLVTPDPAVTIAGCANAGSPCKFTATSISGATMSDWTFAWTLKLNGAAVKTGTSNPFEPAVTAPGNYTISLKVTKSIFDTTVDKPLTVAGTLCAPLPASHQVAINKSGCGSSCAPGTTVTFSPSFNGYTKQNCDSFSWTFGSGEGNATGESVSHTYSNPGSYTVRMTMTNTNGSIVEETTVTISGGGTDPGNICTAPTTASISYGGSPSGCATGGTCRTTDNITFTARRGANSLQTCDTVNWTFSDNTTSTLRTPVKSFSTPGTYTASMYITNSKGTSQTATQTITVTPPQTGSCTTAPGLGNFAITYAGPSSGCTNINAAECQPSEAISFVSQSFYYTPASCDNYEWDFGDGSPKVNTRNATHAFSASATYAVKLRVYNNAGSSTYSKNVKVQGVVATKPIPVITATSFPATGIKGRVVTFTATSDKANTTAWTWSFGDGTPNDTSQAGETKVSCTVTHTFANKGTFTVRASGRNSEDVPAAPVGTVQATIVISEAPPIPEYRYLLPVAAHTAGQGGSAWRTDVQIYNPDPQVSEAKPLVMDASFKGVTYPLHMIKATHIYEDFLGMLLAQQKDDSGPIIITTKSAMTPPQIWTRTYTQTAHGTFGQFIPAIRLDTAGGAGAVMEGKYYLSGLRHDSRYRTNVGFLNPNAAAINATVTVFDDRHLAIKQFTRALQPFQLDQFLLKSVVDTLPTDRPFSLEIEVPVGQWVVAYASYIDGFSNDPVYLQAVRDSDVSSVDFTTMIIPGVGHIGAWRSDVTIFNPDTSAVQFDLRYYDTAGNKVAEAPGIVLDPFKFLQYDDVLKQGVFGSAPDGIGTLKIVATTPVPNARYPMAFARTYNDDGANGTFGQGISAFGAARPNVRPNKPALLAGVRNTPDYYTNIGLVNLSDVEVTATVKLLDPITGAEAAAIPYTLKANESLVGQFNGFGNITSGTFKIEATGNVWAFCSVIDRRTKDPEYVPATPLQ